MSDAETARLEDALTVAHVRIAQLEDELTAVSRARVERGAFQVMTGRLASAPLEEGYQDLHEERARWAYAQAVAMLKVIDE